MFSISSSGRCEGYQIQILAFPTPDGCDTIGEGDGTETDASSTSREEVDTISVHTHIGSCTKFWSPLPCVHNVLVEEVRGARFITSASLGG